MLQKPPNEGQCRQRTGAHLLAGAITVAKRHAIVLYANNAVVAQRDAEDVRGQVFERCCTTPNRPAIHDPGLLPGFAWYLLVEVGLPYGGTQLGPKENRQRLGRNQERRIARAAKRPIRGERN